MTEDPQNSPERGPSDTSQPEQDTAYLLEQMDRMELVGKYAKLSDGREGKIVHVEYESPERVALIKAYAETPSPLTRAGIDRLSPPHLPYIVELIVEPPPEGKG